MVQVPVVMTQPTMLGVGASVLYTQPANSVGQIVRAVVFNTDTVPRQITIYRVASGGTPSATNTMLSGAGGRVLPGQSLTISPLAGMTLNAGDTIQGLCDAASVVNFAMSGYNNA